jgi:hypothetical protein
MVGTPDRLFYKVEGRVQAQKNRRALQLRRLSSEVFVRLRVRLSSAGDREPKVKIKRAAHLHRNGM